MSYRERLISISKKKSSLLRNTENYEDLLKDKSNEDDVFLGLEEEQLHLYLSLFVKKDENVEDFFNNFSLIEKAEVRYQILTKASLKSLIEQYENEIIEMMDKKLIAYKDDPELAVSDLYMKRQYWRIDNFPSLKSYKLIEEEDRKNDKDGSITSIELMEYQIFNVVHIYNTFDWENDFLIVSGW